MLYFKVNKNLFCLIIFVLISGCISLNNQLVRTGSQPEIIKNAILDFSTTCKLYKKGSVFLVSFYDTVYKMTLKKLDDRNYKWIPNDFYEDICAVGIGANYNRFLLTKEAKVGSKGKLPTRFFEKDGKLFYWWDNDYPLTEETLSVFHKYNLLQDDENGMITIPDFVIDDAQKVAHYYFCRDDLTKYKKIITNIGLGYYEPPRISCRKK